MSRWSSKTVLGVTQTQSIWAGQVEADPAPGSENQKWKYVQWAIVGVGEDSSLVGFEPAAANNTACTTWTKMQGLCVCQTENQKWALQHQFQETDMYFDCDDLWGESDTGTESSPLGRFSPTWGVLNPVLHPHPGVPMTGLTQIIAGDDSIYYKEIDHWIKITKILINARW